MPHLFTEPEFWVLAAAVIFVALVWKPAKRLLIGGLDARALRIREELATARRLRDEAEEALAAYRRQQASAAAEAEAIVTQAKADAQRIAAQMTRDLERLLARRRQLAVERVAQEEQKAVVAIRVAAIDLAIAAARRVVAAELDAARGAALIDTAIAALPNRLQ